ncbi:MAG: hypothetical protein R3314_15345 [Longimicrobiales bacterium]|nr:hypothetical protein [Longimicrobiales bacterium]
MSVFERVRLLGFGLLAVTFVVGALAGAAIDRVVLSDAPEEVREERRDDGGRDRSYIIDRVEMSDAQRAAIDSILERRADRMRAVWHEVEPRLDAITDSARAEIMAVLTPEQRAEYEAKMKRWRDRRGGDREGDDHGREGGGPDRSKKEKDTGG